MKKSIINLCLKILIVALILILFSLLASARNQDPEILVNGEESEQTYNISTTSSLVYYINLDGSARVTMHITFENIDEKDLVLYLVWFGIEEVPANITNIELYTPKGKSINESNCSSNEECVGNITPFEYSHIIYKSPKTERYSNTWIHTFFVGTGNTILKPTAVMYVDVSYTIEDIIGDSHEDTRFIFIPAKRFKHFKGWIIENQSVEYINNDMCLLKKEYIKDLYLQSKEYNIFINLPQDRYHYSQLTSAPIPYPDTVSMAGNAPAISWHFGQNDHTPVIFIKYKIQEDGHLKTFDALGVIALTLAFLSIALAVKSSKHWRILICMVILSYIVVIIITYLYLTLT